MEPLWQCLNRLGSSDLRALRLAESGAFRATDPRLVMWSDQYVRERYRGPVSIGAIDPESPEEEKHHLVERKQARTYLLAW